MRFMGTVTYTGPSMLTGRPIVAILTGLEGATSNPKTGPMVQQWIIPADTSPLEAEQSGADRAVCGTCPLRAHGDVSRRCYVNLLGVQSVYRAWRDGRYLVGLPDTLRYPLRLGAYGDPAALPIDHVRALVALARASGVGWTGYTHQWHRHGARGLRRLLMASVETPAGARRAHRAGWRTFRVSTEGPGSGEITCPASAEAGHRTTCGACQLCNGRTWADGRKSIVIFPHGAAAATAAALGRNWEGGRV